MSTTVVSRTGRAPGWGAHASAWAEQEIQQGPTYAAAPRRVALRPGSRVLDVGCGAGVFLRLAREQGAQPFGLDAAPELNALAEARVPEADLRVGDLQRLPCEANAFDVVCGLNAFYATDMVGALREAGRVGKPGAPVVIQVWGWPERCDLTAVKAALLTLAPPPARGGPPPPLPLWPPGVLESYARAAGLTPRDTFDARYAFVYPDEERLLRRLLGRAPALAAVEASGEALARAVGPFRRPDGSFVLENEWHFCIAAAGGAIRGEADGGAR